MLAWRCSPVPGLQLVVGQVAVAATVDPSGHCLVVGLVTGRAQPGTVGSRWQSGGQVAVAATVDPSGHCLVVGLGVGHVAVAATVDPSGHCLVVGLGGGFWGQVSVAAITAPFQHVLIFR